MKSSYGHLPDAELLVISVDRDRTVIMCSYVDAEVLEEPGTMRDRAEIKGAVGCGGETWDELRLCRL